MHHIKQNTASETKIWKTANTIYCYIFRKVYRHERKHHIKYIWIWMVIVKLWVDNVAILLSSLAILSYMDSFAERHKN